MFPLTMLHVPLNVTPHNACYMLHVPLNIIPHNVTCTHQYCTSQCYTSAYNAVRHNVQIPMFGPVLPF